MVLNTFQNIRHPGKGIFFLSGQFEVRGDIKKHQ